MKKILIKCDYGYETGMGHLSRCISVAREIKKRGHEIIFLANHKEQYFLKRHNLQYITLETNGKDLITEAEEIISIIECEKPQLVLIDSHHVSFTYLKKIDEKCPVAFIEDELKDALPVHLLINGHIYATHCDYEIFYRLHGVQLPQLLLGQKYMPLNVLYSDTIINERPKETVEKTVVFLAGGSDPVHITVKLLEFVNAVLFKFPYKLVVVVGYLNEDYKRIIALAKYNSNINICYGSLNLNKLLAADIAISAAGLTLYELAAFGIPSIAYSLADNQIPVGKAFHVKGLCKYIGDARNNTVFFEKLFSEISLLINDDNCIRTMSKKSMNIVDGKGSIRVANALIRFLEEKGRM